MQTNASFEIIHGDLMFPLDVFLNLTSDLFVYCNYHKDMEIIYIKEGKAAFNINNSTYEASAGQALFINSGYIHTGLPIEDTFCCAYAIVFGLEMLDICQAKYIEPFVNNKYRFPCLISGEHPWEVEILNAISRIIEIFYDKTYGYELSITANLYKILSEIIINKKYIISENDYGNPLKLIQVKKTLKYIQENYTDKIYISELAQEANISKDYFCKIFKSMTGKTPVEYINTYRIHKACSLLEKSEMSVLEIALTVGFEDVSFFIKTFKKLLGITPKIYRQSHRDLS